MQPPVPTRPCGRKVLMTTYTNRWTVSLAWLVGMLIVWSFVVSQSVSTITLFILAAIGLVISLFGAELLSDAQPPRSMSAIIGDLEAQSSVNARGGATESNDSPR